MPDWADAKAPEPVICDSKAEMGGFAAKVATEAKGCGRVLLFVHGYNTTFKTSLLRAGQIATDTQWTCAVALFSWSSEAKYDRYAADIERSGYAAPVLIDVLRALSATGLKVDIVAHSMGARVTLSALAALCEHRAARSTTTTISRTCSMSARRARDG
jgi:esterase/lipase superfamily enzyme